ncbi:MAG: TRAP transporter large permease, partial [bacterium]
MTALVIGLIVTLSAMSVPIGFALIAATLAVVLIGGGTTPVVVPLQLFSGAAKFPLLAIPLFVLAGGLMNSSGISLRIINLASALVGHIRGGLAMVNVVDSMFFAEISGSAVADVAALGSIIIPAMVKKGYTAAFTAALTSVTASLAIIIPPSIPMILYAVMSGTSVTRLFLTGFAPGLIGGLLIMAVVYYKAHKYGFPVDAAFSLPRLARTFKEAGWTLLLPVIILGGMFGGIVTATEAAGLAVLAAFIIGTFVYREMNFRQLRAVTLDGVVQTASVMLIVAASAVLGWYLTNEQVPQRLAEAVLGLTSNRYLVLLFLN